MRGWTIGSTGTSNAPSGSDDHVPDGKIEISPDFKNARQDVKYEYDFNSRADVNPSPDRVDVPVGLDGFGCPNPQCGDTGQVVDFNAVAPDDDDHGDGAPDGSSGSGHGGFVLGADRPD